jgi:hypothetical protein
LKPDGWDTRLRDKRFLKIDSEGLLLKPATDPEVYWYQRDPPAPFTAPAAGDADPRSDPCPRPIKRFATCPAQLRAVVPESFGTWIVAGERYLCLRDLTRGMAHPALLDLKIGRRTFDPFARRDKVDSGLAKYAHQERYAFRVVGMQTYRRGADGTSLVRVTSEEHWGRRLLDWNEDVKARFVTTFVAGMSEPQRRRLLHELELLEATWARFGATQVLTFASSLFVCFETAEPTRIRGGSLRGGIDPHRVVVKLIDFNHAFYRRHHPRVEDGVLQGIRNFRRAVLGVLHGSAGVLGDDPVG